MRRKQILFQKEVKSKTRLYTLVAVLCAVILVSSIYVVTQPTVLYSLTGVPEMKNFASMYELKNYLLTNTQSDFSYILSDPRSPPSDIVHADPPNVFFSSDFDNYSLTNVQVVGVDEADIVKTDGSYIYVLTSYPNSAVQIVKADPKNPTVIGRIAFTNLTTLTGMYLSKDGNRLAVLGGGENNQAFIYVYDVSNKAHPFLTRNMTLSAYYYNLHSRMVDNYIYAVFSQSVYVNDDVVILPQISVDTVTHEITPASIYYTDVKDTYFSCSTFVSLNIMNDAEQPTDMSVLMGASSCMHVSTNNMYITFPGASTCTEIYRVEIDGTHMVFQAKGIVPGYVLNQYSMDEYNDYFRIATTVSTGSWVNREEHNNLYVLNMNLDVVGKIENLAQGECIYSARFVGDKAYLVTFKQMDPFFVIDLKNPTSPKITGELKIPGYSSYLHPYNENYIIGIGKEGNTVKLSLFDVTDMGHPTEIAKYVIGENADYSYSEVLTEPKAFLFDLQKQLLVIPTSIVTYVQSGLLPAEVFLELPRNGTTNNANISNIFSPNILDQKDSLWQGVYVFQLSPENGFTLQNKLSHQTTSNSQNLQELSILRSLYIGNTLYTISNDSMQLNSLDNFNLIAKINF